MLRHLGAVYISGLPLLAHSSELEPSSETLGSGQAQDLCRLLFSLSGILSPHRLFLIECHLKCYLPLAGTIMPPTNVDILSLESVIIYLM